MQEKVTPYLQELSENPVIQLQFYKSPEEDSSLEMFLEDPLGEDSQKWLKD